MRLKNDESRRHRTGLVVLLIGVAMIVIALGLSLIRGAMNVQLGAAAPAGEVDSSIPARAAALLLVFGSILLLVFVVGTYALVRASRQYRARLTHRPAAPTEASDVWRMHRVPEDLLPAEDE